MTTPCKVSSKGQSRVLVLDPLRNGAGTNASRPTHANTGIVQIHLVLPAQFVTASSCCKNLHSCWFQSRLVRGVWLAHAKSEYKAAPMRRAQTWATVVMASAVTA
jgi:hypothetical protein